MLTGGDEGHGGRGRAKGRAGPRGGRREGAGSARAGSGRRVTRDTQGYRVEASLKKGPLTPSCLRSLTVGLWHSSPGHLQWFGGDIRPGETQRDEPYWLLSLASACPLGLRATICSCGCVRAACGIGDVAWEGVESGRQTAARHTSSA